MNAIRDPTQHILQADADAGIAGGMRAMLAQHDWAATALGPVAAWPAGLTAVVQIMLDSAQELVLWWGPDASQLYNDAYRRRIETAGRLSAQGAAGAVAWPDRWKEIGPQFDCILAGEPPVRCENVLIPGSRKDGVEDSYWSYTLTPVRDDGGTIRGALVISTETTARVLTARLRIDDDGRRVIAGQECDRLLLDAPVGAAVMIGEALVYRLVNPIYACVSGRLAQDMVGQAFLTVFPELAGAPVHDKLMEVYRSGAPFVSKPTLVQIRRHGGALDDRYFTYNLAPLRTLAGAVYGLMAIAVDITAEVEARSKVEQLNIELSAAASAKDGFLALLGHELRNPLAPIVAALDLMDLRDPDRSHEQLIIRRQVRHLTRLVDDLLDVSRITRGQVELRTEDMDVCEVLMGAVDMVMPSIDQRQQRLQVDITPLRWHGDPARLAQIVSNLLTNASRYSDAHASITLITRVIGGTFEIAVTDDGMGLSAELLPRIFEPFVQGERQLRSAVGGLGVGLALVKNLAEMHGGSVSARSAGLDQGSTFIVRMPIPLPLYGDCPAAPQRETGAAHQSRILVVDDNPDAADTLAELLRLFGHEVTVAYTAGQALELFGQQAIAVAILDIGLPDITGYALADAMRDSGRNADTRFIALTGFGQESDRERSAAAGFAAHLVKPVDVEALLALV